MEPANEGARIVNHIKLGVCSSIKGSIRVVLYFDVQYLHLPVAAPLQRLVLNHLNPVVVWVQDKRHRSHPAVSQTLLPVNIQALETITGGTQVVNGDT